MSEFTGALKVIDNTLQKIAREVASLWFMILGIFILLAFPLCGIAVSLLLGYAIAIAIGGGALVCVLIAFFFGLFLSVYVWGPHVRERILRASDALKG